MRKITAITAAALMLTPLAIAAGPQTLILRDGTQFQGTFVSGSYNTITFRDDSGQNHRFNISEIQILNFGDNGYSDNAYTNPNNYPGNRKDGNTNRDDSFNNNRDYRNNSNNNPDYRNNSDYRNNPDSRSRYGVIPAGGEINVKTNEMIDSDTATEGRTYSALINRDVADDSGNVVIPEGSEAQLVIRNISRNGDLALDLQSVTVNGNRYLVNSQDVIESGGRQGVGTNRRTAEILGGGTVLGTLLGAIGGGGKGALIGALAGAAAGAGVEVLTKGRKVRVPAETTLNFRLDRPLQLYPSSY